jgi:uncharacterized protein YndB with AHSA1/START domain
VLAVIEPSGRCIAIRREPLVDAAWASIRSSVIGQFCINSRIRCSPGQIGDPCRYGPACPFGCTPAKAPHEKISLACIQRGYGQRIARRNAAYFRDGQVKQRQFQLVSEWRIDAPLDRVWDALCAVEDWPGWWPSVRQVKTLAPGNGNGIGAVNRCTWATALPYDLSFDMTVAAMEPMRRIEGHATGELEGTGVWTLSHGDGGANGATMARYDWHVDAARPWMRRLAPLLAPVFAWNHDVVMHRGEDGLRRHLGAERG